MGLINQNAKLHKLLGPDHQYRQANLYMDKRSKTRRTQNT